MKKLNLKVRIDSHSGFCFGVIYAIEIAEAIIKEQGYLYCLGDIVHNDQELQRLKNLGLRVIDHSDFENISGEKVLLRAHGEPPETYRIALDNNIQLIDASCPVVLKLQNRIRQSFNEEEPIYIYGKRGHAEVKGLVGQTLGNAKIFETLDGLLEQKPPRSFRIYSQTTKNIHSFRKIITKLGDLGYNVTVNDTICRQVANRDKQLEEFAFNFDKIVFIAGSKSSNGKVLYESLKNHKEDVYFISSLSDLRKTYFQADDKVGICGATSTPMWQMEEVRQVLESW